LLKTNTQWYDITDNGSSFDVFEHRMNPGCGAGGIARERKVSKGASGDINAYIDAIVASFNEG